MNGDQAPDPEPAAAAQKSERTRVHLIEDVLVNFLKNTFVHVSSAEMATALSTVAGGTLPGVVKWEASEADYEAAVDAWLATVRERALDRRKQYLAMRAAEATITRSFAAAVAEAIGAQHEADDGPQNVQVN